MTSDVHLQDQQDEFNEWQREQKALEAATLVMGGDSRASAVRAIKDAYIARDDASENEIIRDEDGFPEYLSDEAQTPAIPQDRKTLSQVRAIAKDLIEEFD